MAEDRRVTKTKKAIKQAFIEQLLETRSMSKISVTKLVDVADISRGAFYLHYTDIFHVLQEVEDDLIKEFSEALLNHELETVDSSLQPLIKEIMAFVMKHDQILKILVKDSADQNFTQKLKSTTKEKLFSDWEQVYGERPNRYHEYYYSFIFAGTVDLILEWFQGEIEETPDSMVEIIEQMVTAGRIYLSDKI